MKREKDLVKISFDLFDQQRALMPAIQTLLNGSPPSRILLCVGPGSYTGLRIGAMTAKTLAFIYQIPLHPFRAGESPTDPHPEAPIHLLYESFSTLTKTKPMR